MKSDKNIIYLRITILIFCVVVYKLNTIFDIFVYTSNKYFINAQ